MREFYLVFLAQGLFAPVAMLCSVPLVGMSMNRQDQNLARSLNHILFQQDDHAFLFLSSYPFGELACIRNGW